ncbi:MAG: anaerobic ribonucleoside-triphosphate reductase activating protein [Clostridiales bacterium]|nr:anaerobic ribonucleoside-triphosphate reductase activating protein [Clostridiales bacterium]
MNIAGLVKSSLVDFPGHIAAAVFTPGCNFDCFYCHNRPLLSADAPLLSGEEVMSFLRRRAGLLEAVVVTGGEPTLQPGLAEFIRAARALSYRIKLDTNGSRPEVVDALLREGLIDFVALDYKAPFERYPELCGAAADPGPVRRTMALLRERGVAYELRTTFVPQLTVDDIAAMTAEVAPIPRYALQTYRPPEVFRQEDRFRVLATPHPPSALKAAAAAAEPHAGTIVMR